MTTNNWTPTPWYTKEGQVYNETDGRTLALIPYFDTDNERDVANAEHIVKCVNSHDALVNAIQECLMAISMHENLNSNYLNTAKVIARQALKDTEK